MKYWFQICIITIKLSTEHRSIYNVYNMSVEYINFTLPTYNHGQKLWRHVKIANLFPWCKFSPPPVNGEWSPLLNGSLPFPLFQCWKQQNIHEAFCNIVLGGGGDYR